MSTPEKADAKAIAGDGALRDEDLHNVTGGFGDIDPRNFPNLGLPPDPFPKSSGAPDLTTRLTGPGQPALIPGRRWR